MISPKRRTIMPPHPREWRYACPEHSESANYVCFKNIISTVLYCSSVMCYRIRYARFSSTTTYKVRVGRRSIPGEIYAGRERSRPFTVSRAKKKFPLLLDREEVFCQRISVQIVISAEAIFAAVRAFSSSKARLAFIVRPSVSSANRERRKGVTAFPVIPA